MPAGRVLTKSRRFTSAIILRLLPYFYIFLCVTIAAPLAGQSIEIHSEFQRINPFGEIVAADRSQAPREILSPEIPRNAHSVFHVSVTMPENTSYFLYVGTNPPNLIEATLYKEDFARVGDEWIPDALSPIRMPSYGYMPDFAAGIPGQTTRCYLLDIWVPPQVEVQRIRVEVLMKIGIWFVAPMELRIGQARVPLYSEGSDKPFSTRNPEDLPDIGDRIDASATEYLARYLLGWPQIPPDGNMENIRDVVRRSACQDLAIARQHAQVQQALWFLAEDGILQTWMRNPGMPYWSGAEWFLRVRDWIYRNEKN